MVLIEEKNLWGWGIFLKKRRKKKICLTVTENSCPKKEREDGRDSKYMKCSIVGVFF